MNPNGKVYLAQPAKSNRAQCRETSCKQNIGFGELRIGHDRGDVYHWYHAACCFKTFENRYLRNPQILSFHEIDGYDNLSEDHKKIIRDLIAGIYVEPVIVSSRPRRNLTAPKLKESATNNTVEETKDEQPKKRARKTSSISK
jgi:hypothetical protein